MGTIQPPFRLYTLRVEPGARNSPPEPAVFIIKESEGLSLGWHTLTPEQAREMAADLIAAAHAVDPQWHVVVDTDTGETLAGPLPHDDATALVASTVGRNVHVQAVTR